MIRRPPRSTLDRSSAASDVYKRQRQIRKSSQWSCDERPHPAQAGRHLGQRSGRESVSVSYTHLRAHETVLDLVCRLLLEKKKKHTIEEATTQNHAQHTQRAERYTS